MNNRYLYIIAAIMLFALAFQAISSMMRESPVCDEVSHHIATGYSFLKTKDFRLNSTSPPLTEELSAIGLLFLKPRVPLDHPSWEKIDRVDFGFQFLYRYNNNADQLVFYSRIPMVLLSILCAILVFIFAKDLYGEKAGLFALFLYTFSPNILAYSKLVTPDIGVTFFILLALYRFYKFLNKPKLRNILLSGISLGLAEASKLSALILIPLFIIICLYRSIESKRPEYITKLLAIFVICAIVIFAVYFGEIKPLLKNDIDVYEKIEYIHKGIDRLFPGDNQKIKQNVVDFALNTPVPFATYIMNILAETNMVFVKPYPAFLMGEYSQRGWWYYYIVTFLVKTPIPMLLLLVLLVLFFKRVQPKHIWGEGAGVIFLLFFSIVTFFSKVQLSVRYILPIYPLCFIYISKLINLHIKRERFLRYTLFGLSLWYLIGTISIWPNYLAYFNQMAGGPNEGWGWLRDANIDYGQDLPALADYLNRYNVPEVKLLYCGTADPGYYGIRYKHLDEKDKIKPDKEVYAISVNYIGCIKWRDDIAPTAKAGYSIFIYDFRDEKPSDTKI